MISLPTTALRRGALALLLTVTCIVASYANPSGAQWTMEDAWAPANDPARADGFVHVSALSALHDVPEKGFTELAPHPLFPELSARIKLTDWCDGTVKWAFPDCAAVCARVDF